MEYRRVLIDGDALVVVFDMCSSTDVPRSLRWLATYSPMMSCWHLITMYEQPEYIGRALNVACRLQASIKDEDRSPAYKALVSNTAYITYFSAALRQVKVWTLKRKLRNIRDGADFNRKKIEFLNLRTN